MKRLLILLAGLLTTNVLGEQDMLPRPTICPAVQTELTRLLADTRVGDAQSYKNLTVFPLFTAGRAPHGYWTLEQALAKDLVRISEKGEGSVPELLVENRLDAPIFLMAGEIVTGGKQNRVISQDILLAPHSGPTGLGVFCVEQGRWTSQNRYFASGGELAHSQLRYELNSPQVAQAQVWNEVAQKAESLGAIVASPGLNGEANPTHYVGKIYEAPEVKDRVDGYSKAIAWTADANGMAVMIDGRVVGVEIFGDSETFAKLRDKLLRSYAVDAIERNASDKFIGGGREAVERFLRSARQVRLVAKETIGIGRLLGVEGNDLYGSVLLWHEQKGAYGVVHTSLFAGSSEPEHSEIPPVPTPRPLPPRVVY